MPDDPIDPATANDPKKQVRDTAGNAPGLGCFIIPLIFVFFFSLIIFLTIFSGSRQGKAIMKFTDVESIEPPIEAGTPADIERIRAKLANFNTTIREKKPATLNLTASDLNILVHNETALMELRKMVFFEKITPDGIAAQISMPLNVFPPWKPKRYLNGKTNMIVEASRGRLFLRLKSITAPGKEIPEGFIENISQDDLLDPYKNEDNEDIIESIESATMNDGSVTIESKPVENTKEKK